MTGTTPHYCLMLGFKLLGQLLEPIHKVGLHPQPKLGASMLQALGRTGGVRKASSKWRT
jgi:hypothetical protein